MRNKSKSIQKAVQLNLEEVKDFLKHIITNNVELQKINEDPVSINISGLSGIGKTSVVKQLAEELKITHFVKRNLSQLDDLGDLTGFPIKEYETVKQEQEQSKTVKKIKWVAEAILPTAIEKGFVPTGKNRMGYAKPEWFVGKEQGTGILFLDDWTRTQPRFIQAVMEIVDNQSYHSWKLPPGWTVVLSSNPDNGDFNVVSEDDAQKTRYFKIDAKFDAAVWARYAESIKIDERCINFTLLHPELVTEETNPRIITKFYNSIRFIKDFAKPESLVLIQNLGEASVGSEFATMFVTFIHDKLDKLVSPTEVFACADHEEAISKIKRFVGTGDQYRPAIASVITTRMINYTLELIKNSSLNKKHVDRYGAIVEDDKLLGNDLTYMMVRDVIAPNRNRFLDILSKQKIAEKILQ